MNKKYNKIVWILLAISLCFNIFFAGGYVFSRHILRKLRTPEGRIELIAKRLKLSESQKEGFQQLGYQLQTHAGKIKQSYQTDIDSFWQEAVNDNRDSLKINDLLDRLSQGRKEYMMLASEHLYEFLKVLNAEQRRAYIRFLRKRGVLRSD